MNARAGVMALLFISSLTACWHMDKKRARLIETAPSRHLIGVWDVKFTADRSLASANGKYATAMGEIALVQDHFDRSSFPQITAPTHYGVYDIDFRRFGFEPRGEYVVPFAVAAVTPAVRRTFMDETPDSLHIVLNPGESQIAIAMDGVITTDSAFGTWRVGSRSASGSGTFTMSPHQSLR